MKVLRQKNYQSILDGANLLGTGGGGTISSGLSLTKKISKPIELISLNELKGNEIVCTVFGVGGKGSCNPLIASQNAMNIFQKILRKKISALIPVETGAESIGTVLFIASELNIPVLDSDIVGLRSSPEIYLETITLKGLSRTPCSIADDKGNSAVLLESKDLNQLEKFLRGFALSVGGDAFVAGYPLLAKDLLNTVPDGSISLAEQTGKKLKQLRKQTLSLEEFLKSEEWQLLGTGVIVGVKKDASQGFARGAYQIRNKNDSFFVVFKNENLVVLENEKVLLTCPDSINLLDLSTFKAINNFEDNKGKRVVILGKKAIPIWRTKEGKKLFSPKNLGFSYAQKLLS